MLRLGRVQGAAARQHLGLLYNLYTATYPTSPQEPGFDTTIREAVTDLELIAIEQAVLSWGQLTQRND